MKMNANVDPMELDKFEANAARWWDAGGEYKTLHDINPLRLDYVDARARLRAKEVVDVGCGGGLLSEAMARRGARVTGIDLGQAAIKVAQLHLRESGLDVAYRHTAAERLADEQPERYDVVTCMELLEHVPDPASLVRACARLAKPGGDVFFSTINRNPKSWLLAIVGAEYALGLLPRGTHEYRKLVRPSELAAFARDGGLAVKDLRGMRYNPLARRASLTRDVGVNYLAHCRKQQ